MAGASVYRLFDAEDRLLYVGCSDCVECRLDQHRLSKRWFGDIARHTVDEFPTRREALAAERVAIQTETPLHNHDGAGLLQSLLTIPMEKTELRCLKLVALKAETSMSALVRRGIGAVLNELSPEEGETWEGMQIRRDKRRSLIA
jgi:predicted GIY-YIG superfamily endonuclease